MVPAVRNNEVILCHSLLYKRPDSKSTRDEVVSGLFRYYNIINIVFKAIFPCFALVHHPINMYDIIYPLLSNY